MNFSCLCKSIHLLIDVVVLDGTVWGGGWIITRKLFGFNLLDVFCILRASFGGGASVRL